jgi:hypothetical protein
LFTTQRTIDSSQSGIAITRDSIKLVEPINLFF